MRSVGEAERSGTPIGIRRRGIALFHAPSRIPFAVMTSLRCFAAAFALPLLAGAVVCQSAADDARLLASAANRFGAALHAQLGAGPTPTASPGSVAVALLMLLPGARGDTEQELRTVLQLPDELRGARLHAAAKALLDGLVQKAPGGRDQGAQLRLVDDVWAQTGYPILPEYTNLLRSSYAANVHGVPFATDPAKARQQINGHIAAVTNQRIPELLPPDLITPATCVVLTNAIWLKAAWLHPFSEGGTASRSFTLGDGTPVDVPTMTGSETFGWSETAAWQCVALPFADCTIVAEFIVPRAGHDLATAERALLAGEPAAARQDALVHVQLPKFRVAASHRLEVPLRALGLRAAFDPKLADFTGITPRRELVVDDVVHQTWIQVDEQGAEAAAATAVVIKRGSAGGGERRQFVADRAFAFTLREMKSGLVLFVGRVTDPRQAATAAGRH